MMAVSEIRKDYKLLSLSENEVAKNPFDQFNTWWEQALLSNIDEVNAMTLATVNAEQKPSARIVLLKGIKEDGFEFFTNYQSHKARDIDANNNVALVIFWAALERQIRIEGTVSKTSNEVSNSYFLSRPKDSKLGAWASPQSTIIESRNELETAIEKIKQTFDSTEIVRPIFWGGYIVKPVIIEFWQGRPNRLHDRIEYFLQNGEWKIRRLAP